MRTTLAFVLAAALAGGCKHNDAAKTTTEPGMGSGGTATGDTAGSGSADTTAKAPRAIATLAGTKGHEGVKGTIQFVEEPGHGVLVNAHVEGLTPGDHGFHIHEKGDCSAPDATSAGGHFNPSGHKHGAPDGAEHHEGDLGNLTAGDDGVADKIITLTDISLTDGAANDVIGKGFILHDKADDFTTQPTGNAGGRVACGVVVLAKK